MKRTISVEVGKGSVNHNSRKFKAENVDGARSHLNIDYCNERIQDVYQMLFGPAQERFNARQKRADRRIPNYYEKICTGHQEKPFHEIIIQIGNKDDMSALGENAELAKTVLNEYYQGFQARNPNLYVFSAHLHMDEATPHLHIDFVPFITGSKCGLDTRVSLKQALAAQGFKGGTRSDTEWNQWVRSEKADLAAKMEQHGIEWEQKGTHDKHLSVLDYKKQERSREVQQLGEEIDERRCEVHNLQQQAEKYKQALEDCKLTEDMLETAPEYQLPEPPALMSAKTYKTRFVDALVERLKKLAKTLLARYFEVLNDYFRINANNGKLYRENENLRAANAWLSQKNDRLEIENRNYFLLRKRLGKQQLDALVEQAKAAKHTTRSKNETRER